MRFARSCQGFVNFNFFLWLFLFGIGGVSSSPTPYNPLAFDAFFNGSFFDTEAAFQRHAKRAGGVSLRILPLGASITWGLMSSTGNGYRKPLRDKLRFAGWDVDMVGSKSNGNMVDNEVEAHSGDLIDQVAAASKNSLGYQPNVVLINAGTNDCTGNVDIGNAGSRMSNLIQGLLDASGWDRTTIVLSTLTPSLDTTCEANRPSINEQYRSLVSAMQAEGKTVVIADMDPPSPDAGNGWMHYPDDYADTSVHPNDQGYTKMAYVWWTAINAASDKGFLQQPYDLVLGVDNTCDKVAGGAVGAGGLTQRGSGEDDGIYYHSSAEKGIVLTISSAYDRNQWFFARLFSRDRDDLVGWFDDSSGKVLYGTWRNTGDTANLFVKIADMDVGDNCIPRGVHFIDLNADGLDDFACIGTDGDVYASINNGDGTTSNPPTFKSIGKIKENEAGYDQAHTRLADIDGDGRADYCALEDNGDISCWRNGWVDDVPAYWQPLGNVFTGKGMGDLSGVRFEDINGDGRDDWLWVSDVGQTTTWTNSRSCVNGATGNGVTPAWRQGFAKGQSSGPTHPGMGGFASSGLRDRIHFARIYGVPEDFGLLGRQDYVFMEHTEVSDSEHRFDIHVWQNLGSGSTKLKPDGDGYCNMLGHPNGEMDYVWILSKGQMRIFENQGMKFVSDGGPNFWGANYIMWDPTTQAIGRNLDRRDLHLVDWDGDGACDIVWTDPDNQNRVSLWRNTVKQTGSIGWEYDANPAPDLYCPEKRGIGIFDLPVQMHDITGDNKGDYLCLEKDGRVWGFTQNAAGGWDYVDQIKSSASHDRANLDWGDVNGDGLLDLIWTDKFNGDGYVWYNRGRNDIGGSRYQWDDVGKKYAGGYAGSCTYHPDLDGDGRADLHSITASWYNTAETWFNRCPGLLDATGDDPDGVHDPDLPVMPTGTTGGDGSDYPQRFGGSDPNCAQHQPFFDQTFYVGNDQGGDPFCAAKWVDGIFPNKIEAQANENDLAYLKVTFTDNSYMEMGTQVPDDGHHRYGTLQWTPFIDTFSSFSLWADGYNGGVGRLVAGITGGDSIDAGKYWDNPPPEYPIGRGFDGKGMLMGFYGSAGDRIDSLEPIFSSTGPNRVSLTNATFNPSYEALNTLPFSQRKMEVVSVWATHTNNLDTPTEVDVELRITYSKQTKVSFGTEQDQEKGGEIGSTIGGEIAWKVGIPFAVEESGKTKMEVTGKYVQKDVYKTMNSEEDTESTEIQTRIILKPEVDPGKTVQCIASAIQSSVSLQYNTTVELFFNDGNSYKYEASGIFANTLGSQVVSNCGYVDDDSELGTYEIDTVIATGTFCNLDGTQIGDDDLGEDAYYTDCPNDWQNL